jgi:hypothetical protein
MAVRIRENGQILCAAMHPEEPGDTYIHDVLHYRLSADLGVLVTEPMYCDGGRCGHAYHGEWWWRDRVPADIELASHYVKRRGLAQFIAFGAKRKTASAGGPVVGLNVVALGALVVVVMFFGARLLGMERVYLRHLSPPFAQDRPRAYSGIAGVVA